MAALEITPEVKEPEAKRKKYKCSKENESDTIAANLFDWMAERNFKISSKVKMSKVGSCARYGLIAVQDVEQGEVLFEIPRSSLLWEQNCSISEALCSVDFPESKSGWVKLVLCLMYEYTNQESEFRPYLDFAPPVSCMDQPMFWKDNCSKWLKGTGLLEMILKDCALMEKEYTEIALPFIKENSKIGFDHKVHTLELYKHMVAFIMGYSFTEPSDDPETNNTPVMVPMADVLNHIAKNNAQLEFEKDYLKMVAVEAIHSGSEVYNTYGCLANWQLLQMYGFVQEWPENLYDTVDVKLSLIYDTLMEDDGLFCLLDEKIKWLQNEGELARDDVLTIGCKGILSCLEVKRLSKALLATRDEFAAFADAEECDDSDWESDSSDSSDDEREDFEVVSYRKISEMPGEFRNLLERVARKCLTNFAVFTECGSPSHLAAGDENLDSSASSTRWRSQRARTLVEGQRRILQLLLDAVTANK